MGGVVKKFKKFKNLVDILYGFDYNINTKREISS